MKLLLSLMFVICSSVSGACEFDAKSIYGGFIYEKGDTVFEDFELNEDGTFNSWLHSRPASSGTWSIKNCMIIIVEGSESYRTEMKVVRLSSKKLVARFNDLTVNAQFKRAE